eukprot:scaffold1244_cov162-Ochromonas_danica.AAC.2
MDNPFAPLIHSKGGEGRVELEYSQPVQSFHVGVQARVDGVRADGHAVAVAVRFGQLHTASHLS